MKRAGRRTGLVGGVALVALAFSACSADFGTGVPDGPAPPRNLDVWYYAHAVHLSWDLDSRWDGEPFRVYAKRVTDPDYFLTAEVSNCQDGRCSYRDVNIVAGVSYEYFVSAVDPSTGEEAASSVSIQVAVPHPVPPPVPGGVDAVPLDDAVFLKWDDRSRDAGDFSFYRIYLQGGDGSVLLLGETDSEGFLDLLVQNGNTYGYFVTAVDDQGHESEGAPWPRPPPGPTTTARSSSPGRTCPQSRASDSRRMSSRTPSSPETTRTGISGWRWTSRDGGWCPPRGSRCTGGPSR